MSSLFRIQERIYEGTFEVCPSNEIKTSDVCLLRYRFFLAHMVQR